MLRFGFVCWESSGCEVLKNIYCCIFLDFCGRVKLENCWWFDGDVQRICPIHFEPFWNFNFLFVAFVCIES